MTEYTPLGSEFLVNSTTVGDQIEPSITALADGGFVVTWTSSGQDGNWDIYAQRYDADGTAAGAEFRVNSTIASSQYFPSITKLADGGFVVSWTSYGQDGSDWGIYAQRYAADGTAAGAEFRVNSTTASEQFELSVTALADGGFVVSWTSKYQDGSSFGIYAQRYAADGTAAGVEFLVNSTTAGHQDDPSITGLADGGFVVSWMSNYQDGSGWGIYAQRYAADGTAAGAEFRVNSTTAGDQNSPSITALADGGFVVSWMSYFQDGDSWGAYAQRYAADGTAAGAEFRVNSTTASEQFELSVTALADGGFVVSWTSKYQDGSSFGIYAQRYAADGTAAGAEFRVNSTTASEQYASSITALADGGFVVSWMSNDQDGSSFGIYAQRYAADGTAAGAEFLVNSTTASTQEQPSVTALVGGGFVVSWHSYGQDGSGYGIYAQIFGAEESSSPVAQNDAFTTNELTAINGNLFADNGSGADSDPDGPALSVAEVNGSAANVGTQITLASGALLTVNADGTFDYDPNGAFEYTPTPGSGASNTPSADSFTYTLAGGGGATVNLTISGIDNNDQLLGTEADETLSGGAGNDTVDASAGHDRVIGGGGNDSLYGGDGDDYITGGNGDDLIDGGGGYDRAGYCHTDESVGGATVDLNIVGPQNTGSQGWDTLTGIAYVSGTPFADTLTGDGNDNVLWGSAATIDPGINWVSTSNNDTLDGGGGNDLLYVGIGNHSLTGGSGTDTVGFTENWGDDPAIRVSLALQGAAQDTGQGLWTLNGIENLSGGNDNDELTGNDNDNILAGSYGNDALVGGGGQDTLYGDGLFDSGAPRSGPPTLFPDVGANGDDLLEGGLGDDQLFGGGGIDTASYAHASGGVNVNLGTGFASGADGNDTLSSIENVTGSEFNDTLNGSGGDNVLDGLGGNDDIRGQGGNDTIYGGDGDDFLRGDAAAETSLTVSGNDVLYGGNGNDNLRGGLGDDQLYGGANNDLMRGNGGVDYFDGGTDDGEGFNGIGDRISFFDQRATQGVIADLRTGIISNDGFGNVEAMVGIESLGADTAYVDTFYGDDNRNFLGGSLGDNLYGFGGDDAFLTGSAAAVIDGGLGTDVLGLSSTGTWLVPDTNADGLAELAAAATSGWTVNLATGTIVDGYGNSGSVTGIENVNGSHLDDSITGDANANVLNGFDGNDTLEGGEGDDTLDGGNGSDTASYASASGTVEAYLDNGGYGEAFGAAGYDQLHDIENLIGSAFNDGLGGNNLDNVIDGGDGHDGLRGRGGNDTLYGGNGDDFLNGGLGDDTLDGGAGYDRVSFYTDATAGVTVDLNLQGIAQDTGQGMDTLIGIENASGTAFNDTLIGDEGDNFLWGSVSYLADGTPTGANNDTLDGNDGNDLLIVGIGNHSLSGGSGTDSVSFTENGAPEPGLTISLELQGVAQATGAGSWTLSGIENLSGSLADDTLTGDGSDNVLAGHTGNDTLIGGAGNDTLYGDGQIYWDSHGTGGSGPITTYADVALIDPTLVDGNDTLEGGDGDDQLYGGGGSDTASYANASGGVSAGLDVGGSAGAAGFDTFHSIENILGSAFNDQFGGSSGDNVIDGGDGHDIVVGRGGNDILIGGDGDDYLRGDDGGAGDDILDGGSGWDRAVYAAGALSGVTVDLNIQGVAQNTGSQGWDTLISIEHVSGTAFDDTIIGNSGDNWLRTWGGNDTITGGDGNDLIESWPGDNVLDGGNGVDTWSFFGDGLYVPGPVNVSLALQGAVQDTGQGMMLSTGFENLSGTIHGDTLAGDGGDNVIAGDLGNDALSGGAGNDVLYGDGSIFVDWHGNGGSGPITQFADMTFILGGVAGDDLLEGGLGDDTLDGGGGVDTASFANASGAVNVNLGTGIASGADGNDTLVNIENAIGSEYNDTLDGSGGDNVLEGLGGNDFILGQDGNDTIYGGDGNDTLRGDSGNPNSLTVSGDDIIYGGDGNDLLYGGFGDDQLYGGANNDLLRGGGGVDYFDGGTDDGQNFPYGIGDRISFLEQGATQGVIADLRTGIISNDGFGNVETMVGIESFSGDTQYADTFYGDDNRNLLNGNLGDNLHGFGGDDLMQLNSAAVIVDGGSGTDLLALSSGGSWLIADTNGDGLADLAEAATSGWTVNLAAGTTVDGYGNSGGVTGIENVNGSHLGDSITGDANANVLNGVDGDDTLEGGLGDDTLDGGNGNDTVSYANASGSVTVTLTALGGSSSGADGNDNLTSLENVTGSGFNDMITGNDATNILVGGAGNDNLNGSGGDDTLVGGAGSDTLDGGAGVDTADYSASSAAVSVNLSSGNFSGGDASGDVVSNVENVLGSAFADKLIGNSVSNLLNGGEGNDIITGGGGADTMLGGGGSDNFIFKTVADIGGAGNSDWIMDFDAGGASAATRVDLIDLSAIDASTKSANKDDAFTFIGAAQFSNKAGQLRYDAATSTLSGDVNGDGIADFSLNIIVLGALDSSDFVL